MNPEIAKTLAQDDFRLFSQGACHVFAIALVERLPNERYSLQQVAHDIPHTLRYEGSDLWIQDRKCGSHVYAVAGDFLVDVFGIRRKTDYLRWITSKLRSEGVTEPSVLSVDVSKSELLRKNMEHHIYGELNLWNHACAAGFVETAMQRASKLIDECPARYCVSLINERTKLLDSDVEHDWGSSRAL